MRSCFALTIAVAMSLALGCDSAKDDAKTASNTGGGGNGGDAVVQPDTTPGADGTITGGDTGGTTPSGAATLSFVVKHGGNASVQFSGLWKPSIPGYDGEGTVVILLCRTDDPTCKSPVVKREALAAEIDGGLIQNSFGPTITLAGLPAGTFKLMVIEDSKASQELGFGWKDGFPTTEVEWGGVVSESDLMLSDPADPVESAHNPPPMAMDVTLMNGQSTDLGDVILGHYHQRDISPKPKTEQGVIAVATENGVRVVSLADMTVKTAYQAAGAAYYDYVMVDENDDAVDGYVCGMVRGAGSTVWVLYLDAAAKDAGFAIPFDAVKGEQVGRNRVIFPGTAQESPCRGIYHEAGGKKYLWVTDAAGPDKANGKLWYVEVSAIGAGDVTAGAVDESTDAFYKDGVDQIAALGDTLYFASNSMAEPCTGLSCAFKASFDATGKPTLLMNGGDYDALVGPVLNGSVTGPKGEVSCVTTPPFAGMAIAPFHDGRNLLFLGQCLEITVFDLATGGKLDFNGPAPGKVGMDASLFGQGFVSFSLSPDGKTLWGISNDKSLIHFNFEKGKGGARQTYNRWMLIPIDLTVGDLPGIVPQYNKDDIDGFEGKTSIGIYDTPAVDPGVDVDFAYLKKYLVLWAPGLAGATPTAIPNGPTIAAANNTLWMRGSGISGVSGLGNQGNLGVFALDAARIVLWPRGDRPFYEVWTGGVDTNWGFDLTPESDLSVATHGLQYFSL